jgi:carbonic anhydrase
MAKKPIVYLMALTFVGSILSGSPLRASDPHATPTAVAKDPETLWKDLVSGNQRYMRGEMSSPDVKALRSELAKGQHPQVIVLGCADSRVPPEIVFDKSLGDLFVVRTAGNITDPVALGSLEYAVDHLKSPVLLILGHEKCGAVEATLIGGHLPTTNLQAIVDKINLALKPLRGKYFGDELRVMAERANIAQSAKDIQANSPIIKTAVAKKKLTVIQAIYHLDTGEVERLYR